MTNTANSYTPDYAIPPGATLVEVLEDEGMSQAELARRTGLSTKHISQISTGQAPISVDSAMRIESATKVPARVWMGLESRYQEHLARLAENDRLGDEIELLNVLPIAAMVKRGLLTKRTKPVQRLREVYAFFGVADRSSLERTWGTTVASFRKSRSHTSDTWAVAVWLRVGEIQASKLPTQPFDEARFRATLREVRTLTVESDPRLWHSRLVDMCSTSGVAVVVVDEIPGARTHGAARWLAPDRALIQLSIRYKWSDIFWFSFFHEAKHILDQAKRSIVLETKDKGADKSSAEEAADRFAGDFLIPRAFVAQLSAIRNDTEIVEVAKTLDIHPGIVVGRLQHEGWLPYNRGNALRQRLQFADA